MARMTYPEDLRERLLDATRERLRHVRPEEVSLRDLAAECDTSTNAVYSIFGSKDALMEAVLDAASDDFLAPQRALAEQEPSLENLAASGAHYRAWARANPALYALMMQGDPEGQRTWTRGIRAMEPLRTMVAGLVEHGVLKECDVADVCHSLWASTHGFVLMETNMWPDGSPDADRLFRSHLSQIIGGLVNPGARLTPAEPG